MRRFSAASSPPRYFCHPDRGLQSEARDLRFLLGAPPQAGTLAYLPQAMRSFRSKIMPEHVHLLVRSPSAVRWQGRCKR